jgi:hypothetical protein
MPEFKFFSIEEVKEFVSQLKGTRGKADKGEPEAGDANKAPAPLAPPATTATAFNPTGGGFAAPAGGATPTGGAFPAPAASGPAPEVLALVTRLTTRYDALATQGQDPNAMLTWFRNECAKAGLAEAANASMDQIKQACLPKLSVPVLEAMAKLMGA